MPLFKKPVIKICPYKGCGKEHTKRGTFCCKAHAQARQHSAEVLKRIGKSKSKYLKTHKGQLEVRKMTQAREDRNEALKPEVPIEEVMDILSDDDFYDPNWRVVDEW